MFLQLRDDSTIYKSERGQLNMVLENTTNDVYLNALIEQYGFSLTVQDVAEILQVSTGVVYRLMNTKQLPATTIGRQYRIDTKSFSTWFPNRVKRAA